MADFRIADTFTASLGRLTGEEQKAVKTTAFDLQLNPASPGMSFHKLDHAKDKNFWSVRVNRDIRLIVHKTAVSLLLCYVDHHDNAYRWAERRKLETHPKTGAAQMVEIRERVQEIVVPKYVEAAGPAREKPPLFANVSEEVLLGYGVPKEWMNDVRAANEDTLLVLADHLPAEAAEALLELATGGKPVVETTAPPKTDPFAHPDAQRRFRVVHDVEELERALNFPWDKWTVFLHPAQRQLVERDFSGPARVAGSAGTGKTIVALHRAVFLTRSNPEARVLLTTFSATLADALQTRLRRLISNEPRLAERLEVKSIGAVGVRFYELLVGEPKLASRESLLEFLSAAADKIQGHKFGLHFLLTEWEQVVDAWQLETWEAYRDVARLGRKTRLPEAQRAVLWSIFQEVRNVLKSRNLITEAGMFGGIVAVLAKGKRPPFDYVVVDEAQDLSPSHLKFFAAIGGSKPNGLFFAGDLGQRIFQQPFPWRALGVDVRGRSRSLRVNYRTSHQIRSQADRLLGPEVTDADGNAESRKDTVSVFNGPDPGIRIYHTPEEETNAVGSWLAENVRTGVAPHEFGIFVRSAAEIPRARTAAEKAGLPYHVIDQQKAGFGSHATISTMHMAKGLEFRAVAVIACDDEVIPLQERIEKVTEDSDLQEVYDTERHLLYVACTRARDQLLVTGVYPASEFLEDLRN